MHTDHVWGAIDITTTASSNFPDWRNICTINAANTTIISIPRENNKMRLYINLGLEDGLVDTASGRVTAQNIDAKRLLEVRSSIVRMSVSMAADDPISVDCWRSSTAVYVKRGPYRMVDCLCWSVIFRFSLFSF